MIKWKLTIPITIELGFQLIKTLLNVWNIYSVEIKQLDCAVT